MCSFSKDECRGAIEGEFYSATISPTTSLNSFRYLVFLVKVMIFNDSVKSVVFIYM